MFKNRKVLTMLLLIVTVFTFSFIFIKGVEADNWTTLCRYEKTLSDAYLYRGYKSYIRFNSATKKYKVSIYEYKTLNDFNNNIACDSKVKDSDWNNLFSYLKQQNTYSMSDNNQKKLREEAICPTRARLDNMNFWNICFDNGKYCDGDENDGYFNWDITLDLKYSISSDSSKKKDYINNAPDDFSWFGLPENRVDNASDKLNNKTETNKKGQLICDSFLGKYVKESGYQKETLGWFLQKVFSIFKVIAPLLVLGLTIFEFAKAIIFQDQDSLKKASNLFIKRLILMAILFFLPTILSFLLNIVGNKYGVCYIN